MRIDTPLSVSTASADTRPAAAEAERAGYAGVWTSEVRHDPFIAVALAASVTERIELGTAIALAFARSPMTTAVQANDLQMLSQGTGRARQRAVGGPARQDGTHRRR